MSMPTKPRYPDGSPALISRKNGMVRSRKVPLTSVASSVTGTFTSTTCPCRPLYCPSMPLGGGGAFGNNSTGKTLVRSTTSMIRVRSKRDTRCLTCFNGELSIGRASDFVERAAGRDEPATASSSIKPQSRYLRDQFIHPSIVGPKRIHAEYRFFPIAVQL